MFVLIVYLLLSIGSLDSLVSASLLGSFIFDELCENYIPSIPNASIDLIEYIPEKAAANITYRDITCGGPGKTQPVSQDICRVALKINTSETSGIQFEAWLPKNWNGRFLATGNGGIGGCIDYNSLAYTTKHGFAAVGSNNGHNGTMGKAFFNNPGVVEDFASRSLHTATVAGKIITRSFYGRPARKSYYLGCSQGGRQGVGAAEKFPHDFNGIVAGSPGLDFNNLISWRASFYPITGPSTGPNFIKPDVWTNLIHKEVLKQCDELDGVKDGIIENANRCKFNPNTLLCSGGATADCLSAQQVDQVRRIFSPLTYPNGTIIYSAMNPGSEISAVDRLYAGRPFSDSQDWFRYVIYSDPTFDALKFTTRDAAASEERDPFNVRTFPSELHSFQAGGGKLLTYHGQQDQQITSLNTERWYEHLRQGMNASPEQLDKFVRFFRISGMGHCGLGPGAWLIGQTGLAGNVPFEPRFNVLAAIVDWVERGRAPEAIEGTKFVNDVASEGISFRRRHCRYPLVNTFVPKSAPNGFISAVKDSGNLTITAADEWECR